MGMFGSLQTAYEAFDYDCDGEVTYNKFKEGLVRHSVPWQEAAKTSDLRALFLLLDSCHAGTVSLGDFLSAEDLEDASVPLEDIEITQRKRLLAREYEDAARQKKWWNLRSPGKSFDEAKKEDALPVRKIEKQVKKLDPDRMWKESQEHLKQKEERLHAQRVLKSEKEIEGMTLAPEVLP